MTTLDGKVVIVTGAAGLIGRCLVRGLSALGARVVAADVQEVGCHAVASDSPGALSVPTNVTDRSSIERMCDRALGHFGTIDALVHAAALDDKVENGKGPSRMPGLLGFDVERFRQTLEVNVTGAFLVSQVLGAVMASQGRGSIVHIASTYAVVAPDPSLYVDPHGVRTHHKSPAYVASKGAVLALTRHLAAELGEYGVRANTLTPGGVEAAQPGWFVDAYARRTPLGRMASADDLVGAAAFLVSDASRYVTGTNLVVDGGYSAW